MLQTQGISKRAKPHHALPPLNILLMLPPFLPAHPPHLPSPALYFLKLPSVLFSSGLLQQKWIPHLDISGHPATVPTTHVTFLFPLPSLFFTPAHPLVPGQPSSVRWGQGSGAGNLTMAELWQVNSTPAVKLTSVPAELTRHPVSKG